MVAIDLSTKKIVWRHRSGKPIDSRAMVMGGGKVFIYSPDERLTPRPEKRFGRTTILSCVGSSSSLAED